MCPVDQVVILFRDGELLYARIPPLAFDLPVIEAQLQNVDSNSEEAVLPLAAIRQIIIGPSEPAPPREQLQSWDRAAFHFIDVTNGRGPTGLGDASRALHRRFTRSA